MKNHIIIKCIKAGGLDHRLSLHKEYVVIDESDIMYLIKDDQGEETSFRKNRFEIMDLKEHKIPKHIMDSMIAVGAPISKDTTDYDARFRLKALKAITAYRQLVALKMLSEKEKIDILERIYNEYKEQLSPLR